MTPLSSKSRGSIRDASCEFARRPHRPHIADAATIHRAVEETGALVTVEDHYPQGGLGDAVLEVVAGRQLQFRKLAVNGMPRSGDPQALMDHYGISTANIVTTVKEMVNAA